MQLRRDSVFTELCRSCAVVPAETNYLLDPLHPDLRRIKIGTPQKFVTDLRLIKRAERKEALSMKWVGVGMTLRITPSTDPDERSYRIRLPP